MCASEQVSLVSHITRLLELIPFGSSDRLSERSDLKVLVLEAGGR